MIGKFIARGRTAEVYRWSDNYVLKLFYDFIPYDAVLKEYNNTLSICGNANICPSPIEMIKYEDRDGIIYENIKGISLTSVLLNRSLGVKKIADLLAKTQVRIHENSCDNLDSVKDAIVRSISKSNRITEEKKSELLKMLHKMPDDNRLLHMDFHPDNVFYDNSNTFVIDWMTSGKGNPLADVARTIIILRYSAVPFQNPVFRIFIRIFKEKLIRDYLKSYAEVNPIDIKQLDKWIKVVAAARTNERLPEGEIKKLLKIL